MHSRGKDLIKQIMVHGVEIDKTEDRAQIIMAINDAEIKLANYLKTLISDDDAINDIAFKIFPLPEYEKDDKGHPLEEVKDIFQHERLAWMRGAFWVQRKYHEKNNN